jgi:hypothetical protein
MVILGILGVMTWTLLLYTLLHAMLRKKIGAGFMPLHLMDTISVSVIATFHGVLNLINILKNGSLNLFQTLGVITWVLCLLVLIFGIFRAPLARLLKKTYIPIHITFAVLAFAVASTHGFLFVYGLLTRVPR